MRRRAHPLLPALLLAVLASACTAGASAPADAPVATTTAAPTTSATPAPGGASTPPVPTPTAEPGTATDAATATERAREHASEQARQAAERRAEEEARRRDEVVRVLQEGLAAHGYYAGAVDGEAGPATHHAVMAFQKVHGLARDGTIGPQTLAAVESPSSPPLVGGAATRVEVDLDRQVVHLVRGGERVRTFNASSGNGEAYTWPDGRRALADTPVGTFVIERRIEGLREGDLGAMYDPLYFHRGWAIHGSNHVPGHPASHGCVRLPRSDARWLGAQVPNGTPVVVHGTTNSFDPATETVWL